jgi:predicted MFS family arabinose efflux permease
MACYFGDRLRHRGSFVVIAGCVSIVGYAMYLSSTNPNVLYASLFLQIIGVYTVAPLQSTWMRESHDIEIFCAWLIPLANNLAPYYKRATGIALGFVSTNSGGILSTYVTAPKSPT